MFAADLFSDPRVVFNQSDAETAARVRAVVEIHFPQLGPVEDSVWQSGAMEINSSNFRLQTAQGAWLLKKLSPRPDELSIKRVQAALNNKLAAAGLPLPGFLPNARQQNLVVEQDDSAWCLMPFVDGRYFAGEPGELQAAGQVIRDLFLRLREYGADYDALGEILPPGEPELELFEQVGQRDASWSKCLDQDMATQLADCWPGLERDLRQIVDRFPSLAEISGACHIDLHPHNLLLQDGHVVAILDFESLLLAPVDVMVLFGLFKLGRQAMVAQAAGNPAPIRDILSSIVDDLRAQGILGAVERGRIPLAIKAEIIRRIMIILRLSVLEDNDRWNHVLPVQLTALTEAEVLFEGL